MRVFIPEDTPPAPAKASGHVDSIPYVLQEFNEYLNSTKRRYHIQPIQNYTMYPTIAIIAENAFLTPAELTRQ